MAFVLASGSKKSCIGVQSFEWVYLDVLTTGAAGNHRIISMKKRDAPESV
jgi:hypothetical protein